MVLDSGATYTSATPVYEGYPITGAVVKSPVGGDMIVDQCRRVLAEQKIELVPYYKVGSKVCRFWRVELKKRTAFQKEVKDGEPPIWTPRPNLPAVTQSFENYMQGVSAV